MRTLYIAEKKDIGMAIAAYLWPNGAKETTRTYIQGDDNTIVAWASGHLLRNAEPEEYDPSLKSWHHYHIYPAEYRYLPVKTETAKPLLDTLKRLLANTDMVIHAGDPDREGQMLIDELLAYFHYTGPAKRILINAKDEVSMKRAFDSMTDNTAYKPLYEAALARNQADWLVGMNLTRAYTESSRAYGHEGVFRIGRVVVPTLALVVRREEEIASFKSVSYYELTGRFTKNHIPFTAKMIPDDTLPLDPDGHLLDEQVLQAVLLKIQPANATVQTATVTKGKTTPPLPHSLDTLQILANKTFGYSPKQVLDTVESLYMKKFVSYPRSDCQYIPTSQHTDAQTILPMLHQLGIPAAAATDPSLLSNAFNDKHISAHHAIIPTMVSPSGLSETEDHIYRLIATQYCLQFHPPCEWEKIQFTIMAADVLFKGTGTHTLKEGFKAALQGQPCDAPKDESDNLTLPPLTAGDVLTEPQYSIKKKKTTPPKHFTEGTLLAAMANIYRFVAPDNPNREKLKEVKGIGTPATRDQIIAKLQQKSSKLQPEPCLKKEKNKLLPTAFGKLLIAALDPSLTVPDTTALMEMELTDIQNGTKTRKDYLTGVITMVEQNIKHAESYAWPQGSNAKAGAACPVCGKPLLRHLSKKTKEPFWVCSNDSCVSPTTGSKTYYDDRDGEPVLDTCPKCHAILKRRHGKFGYFYTCPACHATFNEKQGKPDVTPKKKPVKKSS